MPAMPSNPRVAGLQGILVTHVEWLARRSLLSLEITKHSDGETKQWHAKWLHNTGSIAIVLDDMQN